MWNIDIDFSLIAYHFYHIAIALALSFPIALNREYRARGAGLRTFPLVAIASCAFMLVGLDVFTEEEPRARVLYGIIGGMGFIGGGAIIKEAGEVAGTATAAGIWNTGAIGISVAFQRYEIAIVLSLIGFIIFQFSERLKKKRTD